MNELLGALCLSEVPDNQLMWAHYGMSLTGFALEFDAGHEYFHEQRSTGDELRHLRRVIYQDARPSGDSSDMDATTLLLINDRKSVVSGKSVSDRVDLDGVRIITQRHHNIDT